MTAAFRVCFDEAGDVDSVLPITSTGFANYDLELMAAMRDWVYSPILLDGVAVPVCTGVTFIYRQR